MISLIEIYKIYFLVGIQLIGGGYVIFPLLKKYLIDEKKLMTEEELTDYLALSQCLPGIIALNISVFSGYNLRKLKGALAATLGLLTPSFVIILILANFIKNFSSNEITAHAFYGVRLSIIVLISAMIYDIFKRSIKTNFSLLLFFVILFCTLNTSLTPTLLIILAIFAAVFHNNFLNMKKYPILYETEHGQNPSGGEEK